MILVFQTKIDKVLNYETPAWQDDIIVVARGTVEDYEAELMNISKKLEDNGYRASTKKFSNNFSKNQPNGAAA